MATAVYSEALANKIIDRVFAGEPLKSICADLGVAPAVVGQWEVNNRGGFRDRLVEARRSQAGQLVEEILAIANDCPLNAVAVSRAAMQIKARQWIVERLHPRTFVQPMVEAPEVEMKTIEPADFLKQWQDRHGPLTTN